MPKCNKEKLEKAYNLYLQGYKLSEIAKEIDVPPGTVRRWKSTHNWECKKGSEKTNERSHKTNERSHDIESIKTDGELDNEKWENFCQYYVKNFNATKAYQKAYDCKYETAAVNGSKLLKNTNIQNRIKELKTGRLAKELIDIDDIVEMMINIAFNDVTDYMEFGRKEVEAANGEVFEINDMRFKESSDVDGRLIAGVTVGRNGSEIKFCDRMKALDWLAEHFGEENTSTENMVADRLNEVFGGLKDVYKKTDRSD